MHLYLKNVSSRRKFQNLMGKILFPTQDLNLGPFGQIHDTSLRPLRHHPLKKTIILNVWLGMMTSKTGQPFLCQSTVT